MDYRLKVEHAAAYFNAENRVVHIAYEGDLDGEVTIQVYDWLEKLYEEIDIQTIRGEIFDFRKVTSFAPDNLTKARRNSNRINMKTDVSQCPVALLVSDFYHEEILRSGMRISPEHARKRIVWSEEEAHSFIEEWQRTNDPAT